MQVGFISDVHANLPALNAVLNDLQDVDRVCSCGDIVGYNAFPEEVIERFRDEGIDSISGNHDRAVVGENAFEFPNPAREVIDWTSNRISNENRSFLAQLPATLRLHIDGNTIQIVHGSPYDLNEYIYPTDLTLNLVDDLDDEVDILVWGHTHYPVVTKLNGVLLLNPGSVGQPRDGDWRASYAVFDTQTDWVELRRQEYNIDKTIKRAVTESFPRQVVDSLRQSD